MVEETITIRRLGPADLAVLDSVADGVFDNAIDADQAVRFLADGCHEMVVAVADSQVVAMASGVVLLHPDKQPQMFINEVGTGDDWLRRGIGRKLVDAILRIAAERACEYVWLATEAENIPARSLYRRMGGRETEGIVMYEWGRTPS